MGNKKKIGELNNRLDDFKSIMFGITDSVKATREKQNENVEDIVKNAKAIELINSKLDKLIEANKNLHNFVLKNTQITTALENRIIMMDEEINGLKIVEPPHVVDAEFVEIKKEEDGERCPWCGKVFKNLSRHKCKEKG